MNREPDQDHCSLCGEPLALQLAKVVDPQTRETFQIAVCPTCRHGVTRPAPVDLARYYGQKYYGGRHGFMSQYCMRRRMRLVRQAIGSRAAAQRRLLDVGCGDGTFLLAAQRQGWKGFGVEMNPDLARAAGLEVFASLDEAAQEGPFDCVTLWHVLEHLPDPLADLTSIRKLLTPDGALLLAVPNAGSLQARLWGAWWLHRDVPRHLQHFSQQSLTLHLRRAGFSAARAWHGEFEYDLLGWSQSALNGACAEPNVFFEILTGKRSAAGRFYRARHLALGGMFCGLGLAPTWWGMATANAGTLIVAARPA